MAAAYQRLSGGRLMLNIVTGGEPREQARFGDTASKEERYARTDEFLSVVRGAWTQAPFDFHGRYFDAEGAEVSGGIDPLPHDLLRWLVGPGRAGRRPARGRLPDLGRAAGAGGARSWTGCAGWPPSRAARCASGCASTRSRATPREEAWAHAQWLLDGLDPATVAKAQEALRQSESTGQRRMLGAALAARRTPRRASSRSRPNLWAGVGLVRGGAGTALVGSHEEVADRLEEYHRLGHRRVHAVGLPARRGGLPVRARA